MASENLRNLEEPSIAILELFPAQGQWREGDYFSLPGNRLVELVDGFVKVLPVPSIHHQLLARHIFLILNEFVESRQLGIVMTAPTRVRIAERHFREPDVLFVSRSNQHLHQEQYWERIDLAVEIISPDDPDRDLIDKRRDYAAAGIAEYWIVDPRDRSLQLLQLEGGSYHSVNEDSRFSVAESPLLPGLTIDIQKLFAIEL